MILVCLMKIKMKKKLNNKNRNYLRPSCKGNENQIDLNILLVIEKYNTLVEVLSTYIRDETIEKDIKTVLKLKKNHGNNNVAFLYAIFLYLTMMN